MATPSTDASGLGSSTPAVERLVSRRGLLRATGATLLASASIAGCTAPRAGSPADYRRWLPAPARLGLDHEAFFWLSHRAVDRYAAAFAPATRRKYRGYLPPLALGDLGVDSGHVESHLFVYPGAESGPAPAAPPGVVLAGAFDRAALRERLRATYGRHREANGFDLYWNPSDDRGGPAAVAFDRRRLLLGRATDGTPARAVVAALLAAERVADGTTGNATGGDATGGDAGSDAPARYVDASRPFGRLAAALGAGDDVSGFSHSPTAATAAERGVFAGEVAKGHRYRFGRETTRSRFAFVFRDAASVPLAAVRRWVDATDDPGDRPFGPYESVEVSREGHVALVDGTLPTRAV